MRLDDYLNKIIQGYTLNVLKILPDKIVDIYNYKKDEVRYAKEEMAKHTLLKTFKERKEKGDLLGNRGR